MLPRRQPIFSAAAISRLFFTLLRCFAADADIILRAAVAAVCYYLCRAIITSHNIHTPSSLHSPSSAITTCPPARLLPAFHFMIIDAAAPALRCHYALLRRCRHDMSF